MFLLMNLLILLSTIGRKKMEHFRWGLIGPGRIAENFAQALTVIDDAELYAIASRNEQRASNFANKYKIENIYLDYNELVNDGKIDAVYIATPHRFHYEQIKLCLEAGKAVLCEKPLTVNAAQSQELMLLAKSKGLFLMEAVWTRFLPIYKQVKNWLDAGVIGEVKSLQSNFGFCIPKDLDDRLYNHDLAGGTLLDMGIYNITVSQWVYGENPESIQAMSLLTETEVDEHTSVNMQYSDGRFSQFTCSFMAKHRNDFCIYGTKGQIKIHDMFWCTNKATLVTESETLTIDKPFRSTGFEYEIEEAMSCIRGGLLESPGITHHDTLATMTVMDTIRQQVGQKYHFE